MKGTKLEAAVDELLKDYRDPEQISGPNGLMKQLTKMLLERAMAAELTHHIGYEKHRPGRNQQAGDGSEAEAAREEEEGRSGSAAGAGVWLLDGGSKADGRVAARLRRTDGGDAIDRRVLDCCL